MKKREKRGRKKNKKKKLELTKKKLRNLEKIEANRQVSVIRKERGDTVLLEEKN